MLIHFSKAEPDGLVAGDGVVLDPVAAGVLVKVDAGVSRLIDVGDIEFGRGMLRSIFTGEPVFVSAALAVLASADLLARRGNLLRRRLA